MSFTDTNTDILPVLAAILKKDSSALDPYYSTLSDSCRTRAYNLILQTLMERGWSFAQATGWFRGNEFETDIAVYFCLVGGAGTIGDDDHIWQQYDRRNELLTVTLVATDGTGIQAHKQNLQVTTGMQPQDDSQGQFYRSVADGEVSQTKW